MNGSGAGVKSAALAGALFAVAGHVALLIAYGTVLPYRDQWQCTAFDLLAPWARGQLHFSAFWTPLNDHWPVLTRLLSYALLTLNGQWNNLLETSVNALIFGGACFVFLKNLLPGLPRLARIGLVVITGAVLALPITWENTLWGIQSLVYLQIALTLIYLSSVCTERRFTRTWWCGHVAGVAVLFTQHSAIIAHVAAAVLLSWRLWRRDGDRKVTGAGLGFAIGVIALFVIFFPSITATASLRADSWRLALDVSLRQLAFPLPHPAWAFLTYLPWFLVIIDRLATKKMGSVDAFIFVLGLWVAGQAAAIGYGRAAQTFTFASRYCDFLALGWLVNAACLGRLWVRFSPRWSRVLITGFALLWLAAPLKSFWVESRGSHADYNLSRRVAMNERNLNRLRDWFQTRDDRVLTADPGTQDELFTFPPSLPPLLQLENFQRLLPPESGSPLARPDHGRLAWVPAIVLKSPWIPLGIGLFFLGFSLWPSRAYVRTEPVFEPDSQSNLSIAFCVASAALCLAGIVAWLCWSQPFVFATTDRLRTAFAPVDTGARLIDLEFDRDTGDFRTVLPTRGAVDTLPASSQVFWYGTRLPTETDYKGTLQSRPFTVTARYIVLPFTGYPCTPGNGLRIRFVNPHSHQIAWQSYIGPDALRDWDIWTIDAEAHHGEQATVFLYDGLQGPGGWLGVGRPALSNDSKFPDLWRARLRAERAEKTHAALVVLVAGSGLSLLISIYFTRRRWLDVFTRFGARRPGH
jgi:hypothetical protein